MTCTVDQRERVEQAAYALRDLSCVVAVDVLEPEAGQHQAWTVDAVVEGRTVPPTVLRELAIYELALRPSPTRPNHCSLVATA